MKKFMLILLFAQLALCGCGKGSNHLPEPVVPEEEEPVVDPPASVADCKQCIILSEQLQQRVAIADVPSGQIFWEWKPAQSNVAPAHVSWFNNISEAKLVYNGAYVLATASGGGVALIRIADKKTVFYAYAGGNTHSAELLPDGNIISSSSTGNFMTLFKVDTLNFPDNVYKKNIPVEFGHNVVWDHKRQQLWTAAMNKMKVFSYNFDCERPSLTLEATYDLPGTEAHDLFPIHGEDALWLTNTTHVYRFDITDKTAHLADDVLLQPHIKSVSSGPEGFPTLILKPKTSWWTDEVLDARGNTVFFEAGLKIYKARWVLPNAFSYPQEHLIRQCEISN